MLDSVTKSARPISKLTVKGDTILDPMMGSGTTGVARAYAE